jgi:hypothetical protein
MEVVPDQHGATFLKQQDQREGKQDLIKMLTMVEAPEKATLKQRAKGQAPKHRGRQGKPKRTRAAGDDEGDIGANHEKAAMGEIDHAHDAKDQGKATADQKQQQPVLLPIQ